jgi:hypothetical protein
MTTSAILVCLWVFFIVALYGKVSSYAKDQARWDTSCINMEIPIDHPARWRSRAAWWVIEFFIALATITWLRSVFTQDLWAAGRTCLAALPAILIGPALFSFKFRGYLNRMREKPSWYVSPSNQYDQFWLWSRRGDVRAAGTTAEAVELLVTTISAAASCVLVGLA